MVRLTVDFWALELRLELSWLRSYLDLMERHLAELPDHPLEALRDALADPDQDFRQPAQQEWDMLSQVAAPRLVRGSY